MTRTFSAAVRSRDINYIFLGSALFAIVAGWLFATLQVAIEPSQILAGLVRYSAASPFSQYQTGTWTLIHQLGALLLRVVPNEAILACVLSILIACTFTVGLSLWAYAICKKPLLSILIGITTLSSIDESYGNSYPITNLASLHTYGALGLALLILLFSFGAIGYFRSAAFLAGLLPCIHPTYGTYGCIILGTLGLSNSNFRIEMLRCWKYFSFGLAITLASLGWFLLTRPHNPAPDASAITECIRAFLALFDGHRPRFEVTNPYIVVSICCLLSFTVVFRRLSLEPGSALQFMLQTYAAVFCVCCLFWLFSETNFPLATVFRLSMPSRLLNWNFIVAIPTLLALTFTLGKEKRLLGAIFFVGVCACFSMLRKPEIESLVILIACPALLFQKKSHGKENIQPSPLPYFLPFALIALATCSISNLHLRWQWYNRVGLHVTNEALSHFPLQSPIYEGIAHCGGMALASTGLGEESRLIQGQSRTPILLEIPSINFVLYQTSTCPDVSKILKEIYGVDIYTAHGPNPYWLGYTQEYFDVWRTRTQQEWIDLANTFGFNSVLSHETLKLELPLVASKGNLSLYSVPGRCPN